jgi:hypothetical protein
MMYEEGKAMITIKNQKLEKWIDEILKRSHYASPTEYLEDRIRRDYEAVKKTSRL